LTLLTFPPLSPVETSLISPLGPHESNPQPANSNIPSPSKITVPLSTFLPLCHPLMSVSLYSVQILYNFPSNIYTSGDSSPQTSYPNRPATHLFYLPK